jgi:hypothetical protein
VKLPANARTLKETAEQAGWRVDIEEQDDGTFVYRYPDGSERTFTDVPTFQVQIFHGTVMMLAGWIKNPVSGRWVTVNAKPVIVRAKDEDDYPDGLTYELNRAIGQNHMWWEWESVKQLTWLLLSDDADMLSHRISRWGKPDTTDDTD